MRSADERPTAGRVSSKDFCAVTTAPDYHKTYATISKKSSAAENDYSAIENDVGFYTDFNRRHDGGLRYGFSGSQTTVVCLKGSDKEIFENNIINDGRSLQKNVGGDDSFVKKRCGPKTSWCNLGRVALVALCIAAVCAIAPSAHARHAQQAEVKALENETQQQTTNALVGEQIVADAGLAHHRNGYPGGLRKSAQLQSAEIHKADVDKSGEVAVSSEDDVTGRGLVSSSAAIDVSGPSLEETGNDASVGGGVSVSDDVTRTDLTQDDVVKNEVRPWWMFAATACDSWQPPQHIYFQVTFLLVVLACCAPARGTRGCLWLRFMMIASSVALFAWALRGDEYMAFYKSGTSSPHGPPNRHQEPSSSSRHTLSLSHHQQSTTPEGFHHRYQEEERFERDGGGSEQFTSKHKREKSCRPDALLWAAAVAAINGAHIAFAVCRALRPRKFSGELEEVYQALFKPLKVTRHQFKKVLGCMKMIRSLKYQEVYAQEKVTKVDSLSLVLSGKLVVSQNQRALHIVFPHQFLDSPEWFGVSTDEYFQVSIMSMEESRVLIWHRDKLRLTIITDRFLQAVFDHILGRDVVKKLMQNCQSTENRHGSQSSSSTKSKMSLRNIKNVSETMAVSNGYIPNSFDDQSEDKPMLILKKNGDGHGITALINRQLQEEHAPLLSRLCPSRPLVRLTVIEPNDGDRTCYEAFDKNQRGFWS